MEIGSSGINGSCIICGQILSPITAAESISSRPLAKQDAAYGAVWALNYSLAESYEKKINASATETLYYTRDLLHSGEWVFYYRRMPHGIVFGRFCPRVCVSVCVSALDMLCWCAIQIYVSSSSSSSSSSSVCDAVTSEILDLES